MANKKELTPKELELQADAFLAAADAAEAAAAATPAKPAKKRGKKAAEAAEEIAPVMTDEEAKKAGLLTMIGKDIDDFSCLFP